MFSALSPETIAGALLTAVTPCRPMPQRYRGVRALSCSFFLTSISWFPFIGRFFIQLRDKRLIPTL